MITIKKATIKDAQIIALLGRVTYSESHAHLINSKVDLLTYNNKFFSVANIISELENEKNIFHIVYIDDFPAGYSKVVFDFSHKNIKTNKVCKLERIYVLEEFLSKKLGIELLNKIVETATDLKYENLWLTVHIHNDRANNFYTKNNFKQIGEFKFKVNDKYFPNFVLSKKLN